MKPHSESVRLAGKRGQRKGCTLRILISGGGLAGLTLAYWLQQDGHSPVVIEKASSFRRDGYGIDFFGTGYDVAERMGIIDWLAARKLPAESVAYVDNDGATIAQLQIALMEKVMHGNYLPLMHWTLEEALYRVLAKTAGHDMDTPADRLMADAEVVRFGCSLQAVEEHGEGVNVVFDDGTHGTFDLVIGADGIHSNTRRLVFGPEEQFARYLGYYVACYKLPDRYGIGHSWQNYTEPQRQVGAYCSDKPGEIITLFMFEAEDEGPIPPRERLARLHREFDGMGWITSQLLADAPAPETIFMDTVTQINMPTWNRGRVGLVGDACGCMTLISGQGASMALGGAYLLAQALRQHADHTAAFNAFEARMRPAIEKRQKNARDFAKAFVPHSRVGLFVQQIVMKIILREAFIPLLRRQFGAGSLLSGAS